VIILLLVCAMILVVVKENFFVSSKEAQTWLPAVLAAEIQPAYRGPSIASKVIVHAIIL